ncbi:MAG: hypothetical protein K1V80_03130 [Muribaculaceae bacterium]|uniref:hypothetical protein n=1 Tax=uncultured Muribaculum sp. TaxID=1918613 RepID=UPI0026EABB29|nr:hypothetical protein [uncultured Muribaculum sp.]
MKVTIEISKTAVLQAASLSGMNETVYEKLLDVVNEVEDVDITESVNNSQELASMPLLVSLGVLIALSDKLDN